MDYCATNTTAVNWLMNGPEKIIYSKSRMCWPWTAITYEQLIALSTWVSWRRVILNMNQLSVLVICPLGVIGSLFSIISLFRKAIKGRDHFYIWMLIIAVMNFLFTLLFIPSILNYDVVFDNVYMYSYWGTLISCNLNAVISFFSLVADMSTLALTTDRFVSICKPTFSVGRKTKRAVLVTTAFVIIAVSLIRYLRVGMGYETVGTMGTNGLITYSWVATSFRDTLFFAGLTATADTAIPLILFFCMVYFSARIGYTIAIRQKNKVVDISKHVNSALEKEKREKNQATLRLLFVLVILFLCNQIGYLLWAVASYVKRNKTITFSSTFEEITYYANVRMFGYGALIIYTAMECLSRSLEFFFYYPLSKTIREDFRKAIGCAQ